MSAIPHLWMRLRRRIALVRADRDLARIQAEAMAIGDRITETSRAIGDLRRAAEAGDSGPDIIRTIDWLHIENEADRQALRHLSARAVDARAAKLRLALSEHIPPRRPAQPDADETRWPAVGLTD